MHQKNYHVHRALGARVMSLQDGSRKMSKSDANDASRINLLDSGDVIRRKIRRCKTDAIVGLDTLAPADWNTEISGVYRPEAVNLLGMYASLSDKTLEEVQQQFQTSNWASFKSELTDLLVASLQPIQSRYADLMENKDYIEDVLNAGADHANGIANKSIGEIKQIMGFYAGGSGRKILR